jgi:hypothetical protein
MFILLARDPKFYDLVMKWADNRLRDIQSGVRPESDRAMVFEAQYCAVAGAKWRKENNGKWREPKEAPKTTYYTEGKTADWFAALSDKEFINACSKAAMDIAGSDMEKYLPITAILLDAIDRIEGHLKSEPKIDPSFESRVIAVIKHAKAKKIL